MARRAVDGVKGCCCSCCTIIEGPRESVPRPPGRTRPLFGRCSYRVMLLPSGVDMVPSGQTFRKKRKFKRNTNKPPPPRPRPLWSVASCFYHVFPFSIDWRCCVGAGICACLSRPGFPLCMRYPSAKPKLCCSTVSVTCLSSGKYTRCGLIFLYLRALCVLHRHRREGLF